MKRKFLTVLFSIVAALCLCFGLAACGETPETPIHMHTFTDYVYNNDATCTEDGTETAKCTGCEEENTRTKFGTRLGHEYLHFTSNGDATCLADGTETAKCERCESRFTRTEQDSALGHDFVQIAAKSPTCAECGWNAHRECSRCGLTDGIEYIPALHVKYEDEGYYYTVVDISPECRDEEIEIPETYFGIPVTDFYLTDSTNLTNLKRIKFPASMMQINRLHSVLNLEQIEVDKACTSYKSVGGILYNRDMTRIEWVPTTYSGEMTVPDSVTEICDGAFENCRYLTRVTLPDGVTSIGRAAFSYCTSLTEIGLPNGVASIGESAFAYCSILKSISVSENVTSIGRYAFQNCALLETIHIPTGLTRIEDYVFSGCNNLKMQLAIPRGVTYIGESAFERCFRLEGDLDLPEGLSEIGEGAFELCIRLTGDLAIPSGVKTIGKAAFRDCLNLTGLTIADGVTEIGYSAFSGCAGIRGEVRIPDSVQKIGQYAFSNSVGITNIILPNCIEKLEVYAFSLLENLREVIIPDSVHEIEIYAFSDCASLTKLTLGSGVTQIGNNAFEGCHKLLEIDDHSALPIVAGSSDHGEIARYAKVVYEGNAAWKQTEDGDGFVFYEDGNESLLIDYYGNETELELPAASPSGKRYAVADYAFGGYSAVRYAETPTYGDLDVGRFYGFTSITIPNGVISIGNHAFSSCDRLNSVTIGGSVAEIGSDVFPCSVREIWISSNAEIGRGAFEEAYGDYIGEGNVSIYRYDAESRQVLEGDFLFYNGENGTELLAYYGNSENLVLPSEAPGGGDYNIMNSAFSHCNFITSIVFSDAVQEIQWDAFTRCSGLTRVTLGKNTHFNDRPFSTGADIKSIEVPAENEYYALQDGVLYNKAKTEILYVPRNIAGSIAVPEGVTEIPGSAFEGCTRLTGVDLPDTLRGIDMYAFRGCTALRDLDIPDSVERIGQDIVSDIPWFISQRDANGGLYIGKHLIAVPPANPRIEFSEFTVKPGTKTIAGRAFAWDASLTNVVLPEGLVSIGEEAFWGCSGLKSIVIPDSVTTIMHEAFLDCTGLESVTIGSGVTSIEWGAFQGCTQLTNVEFKQPDGWSVEQDPSDPSGTVILSENLRDTGTAAQYLNATYSSYFWKREAE